MGTYSKTVDVAALRSDLDKLDGKGEHAHPGNICYADPYYAASLERKYGLSMREMREVIAANETKPVSPTVKAGLIIDFICDRLGVDSGMIDSDVFEEHADALVAYCGEKGIKL